MVPASTAPIPTSAYAPDVAVEPGNAQCRKNPMIPPKTAPAFNAGANAPPDPPQPRVKPVTIGLSRNTASMTSKLAWPRIA